ncbi:glycosyl transferase [Sulfurifustis variabilis]|uniref:Glycosyl transferase n=1 Tax=Sulfurifustis variabilis TaxID=1675686 RepID=A0A1B4V388_9GAMM|nr:MraY family glycosyltransferase [Sulfurifustis variabilis]BAU48026.1 glycosyl transferase [Sulfurifustis variabilis]
MQYLLAFFTALVISVSIIPLMIRLAPRLGLVDRPDARKVHCQPIPRAGGAGIVLGALIPLALWLPIDPLLLAYLWGSLTLLAFGLWDDAVELGHYTKFLGQFVAVLPVVYYADLHVYCLPFSGLEALPDAITKPFTVFAIVGMINALNHSDGLDGLAGGLSVLSLAAIAYLSHGAGDQTAMIVSLSALGGIVGFLRYNTHPARVFMGDGGSQFLGFSLGFLAVLLTQRTNPALSPALPALLLGLPIVDILAVFVQRVYQGMNWFKATRNHIHHRLLDLGFGHYGSVVVIYSVQTVFVLSAVLMSYENDSIILGLYLIICGMLFAFLYTAESHGWRMARTKPAPRLTRLVESLKRHPRFKSALLTAVAMAIAGLFLAASILTSHVPRDMAIGSLALAALLLFLIGVRRDTSILARTVNYITAAFVIYLESQYIPSLGIALVNWAGTAFFALLAVAIGMAMRYAESDFRTTPMDFLILFLVLSVGFLAEQELVQTQLGIMLVKLVIVFYGCELVLSRLGPKWNPLNLSALSALGILGFRGLI